MVHPIAFTRQFVKMGQQAFQTLTARQRTDLGIGRIHPLTDLQHELNHLVTHNAGHVHKRAFLPDQ
jgi:hypothetical protein